jgi:hypothetical protein
MTCVSRIATVRAWLEARLLENGTGPDRTAEILDDSTFVSAGATIYVDFRDPSDPRALTFQFAGGEIRTVFGLGDDARSDETSTPGEPPRSRVSV